MYAQWGFRDNPFQTTSLKADQQGDRLLVGRDEDVSALGVRLSAPPRAVTVEGATGVGKTSLVNVAVFRLLKGYLNSSKGPLFVPALEPLQIADDTNFEEFIDSVYYLLARSLIQRAKEVKGFGWALPSTSALNEWLNSPLITRFGGNLGPIGFQQSIEKNTGDAYVRGAFRSEIQNWLKRVFPQSGAGGVVCLIDNMELLLTSARARQFVEKLRDVLLGLQGVRWVLCGANGITRSVASSPRLDGYLHDPIEVSSLKSTLAADIYTSRVAAFRDSSENSFLPLLSHDFERLFGILGKNTRSSLKYADSYCMTQVTNPPSDDNERRVRFSAWIKSEAGNVEAACKGQVGNRAWQLFDSACQSGNDFAPSDFGGFGFNSSPAMVPHVSTLEQNGLVASAVDETDQRRRTISITPKGWLVYAARVVGGAQSL